MATVEGLQATAPSRRTQRAAVAATAVRKIDSMDSASDAESESSHSSEYMAWSATVRHGWTLPCTAAALIAIPALVAEPSRGALCQAAIALCSCVSFMLVKRFLAPALLRALVSSYSDGSLTPKDRYRMSVAVTSMAHVMVSVPLAWRAYNVPGLWLDEKGDGGYQARVFASSEESYLMAAVSAGYFLFDALQCVTHVEEEGVEMLLHALASFGVYSFPAVSPFLHSYSSFFLLWEVNGPYLNANLMLQKNRMTSSFVYPLNAACLVLSWFFVRIWLGSQYCLMFWRDMLRFLDSPPAEATAVHSALAYFYLAANTLFLFFNVYFLWMMIQKIRRFYAEPAGEGEQNKPRRKRDFLLRPEAPRLHLD